MIEFFVPGKPEPAGSKRAFVIGGRAIVTDANAKSKPWQAEVRAAAADAMKGIGLMMGPLALEVTFYMPRPKGHYRANGLLKPTSPVYHTNKPDSTKLLRGLEDALTGIVWKDDTQVMPTARKIYSATVIGAKVAVRFLETPAFFQAQEAA